MDSFKFLQQKQEYLTENLQYGLSSPEDLSRALRSARSVLKRTSVTGRTRQILSREGDMKRWRSAGVLLCAAAAAAVAAAAPALAPVRKLPALRGGSGLPDTNKMKLSDLQKELRVRGLSTKGLKEELMHRLQAHLDSAGGGTGPEMSASAKRGSPEPADLGADDDEQARQKQAAVAHSPAGAEDEIEGAAESPVPVSVAASPRVHVDATAEGFVKVYNSYSIKDKCRAAGFQFDAAERAWMKPAAAVLENLQAGSLEHVTSEAVLEMIQNTDEAAAEATPIKESEPCRIETHDGLVRVSGGTYRIKDKLRAAGFRWDAESYTWARPESEVIAWINELHTIQGVVAVEAGTAEFADAVLTAVTELDETGQVKSGVSPLKPSLEVRDDRVIVYNSYDIKDQLRALGFRFSAAERAWSRPLEEVLALSPHFAAVADLTIEKLLEVEAPKMDPDAAPAPLLKIVDSEVEVYNSYSVKEQLRALGFRWNTEKACWTHSVESVMKAVGVFSAEEITIEVCTAVGESLVASGETGSQQKPEMRIEGEEVQIYKSYDVREKLRALGFSWNVDNACWCMDAMKLLECMPGLELSRITIDDVLSLEPPEIIKESPRLELVDGEALVHNSYDIRDKLRALGFRWDGSRSVWAQPVDQLLAVAGLDDESQLNVDKLLEIEPPAVDASETKAPYLTCSDEDVCVYNSYDVKDTLRALGFRWHVDKVAWVRPLMEVMSLLGAETSSDITIDKLLACPPPQESTTDDAGNLVGAGGASLKMLNDEVLIYNSYAIKDKLRNLEFRFDSERRAWVRSVFEVKRLLELEDHADITLDKILALSETLPESFTNVDGAGDEAQANQLPAAPELRASNKSLSCRSPSPAMLDQTPGERLLSSMGHTLQGWSKGDGPASAH